MIEKTYKNKCYIVTCDNCGDGAVCRTWAEALEFMLNEGWKKKLRDGKWEHYCQECQERRKRNESQ